MAACGAGGAVERPPSPLIDLLDERNFAHHWLAPFVPAVERDLRVTTSSNLAQEPPDVSFVHLTPSPSGPRVNGFDSHSAQQLAVARV